MGVVRNAYKVLAGKPDVYGRIMFQLGVIR
jgi:hypothetical protein